MSQISSSLGIAPAGAGIQVIGDGNPVHAVGPDGTGLVNLLGTVGDVIVTYNPGAHSVTLSTTGDAANFLTDGIAPNDIAILRSNLPIMEAIQKAKPKLKSLL